VEAALALNMSLMEGRHVRVDRVRLPGSALAAPAGAAAAAAGSQQLDPRRSAYLGNLHYGVDEEEVIKLFEGAGAIEAVRIPRDRASGVARGFGYVCFAEPGASAALRQALLLAGTELRGRPLRVARASSQRASVAASARAAQAAAHAAVQNAPSRREVMDAQAAAAAAAGPAKLARWKERELRAEELAKASGAAPRPAGPAPWEGVHASSIGPAGGAAPKPGKVRVKARWRDLGRESGGTPLISPSALRPDKLARLAGAGRGPSAGGVKPGGGRKAGAKQGVGKDGGKKRISGRKRPAVAQRKAELARKKQTGK